MTEPLRIGMIGVRGIPATYGGIERAVEELSARLAARGHAVTVYCRMQYCESRIPIYRGVRLRYLTAINTKHFEAISHTALASVDGLLRGYDVVHYHGTGPTLMSFLPRAFGRRVVATVQGLDYQRAKWGGFASAVLRAGAWSSAHVPHRTIVVSRTLKRHYESHYRMSPVYVPNGVNSPDEAVNDSPPFGLERGGYLLSLGRLVPEKGIDLLVDAYRGVNTALPLVIAGGGTHSDDYVAALERAAHADTRIRLVGPVYGAEKDALFANAAVFCQPSNLEGLPIALLEAMSHGLASIVSDLPEHLELVDSSSSFVFRRGDRDALATALSSALADRGELVARGAVARATVRRSYDWDSITDQVEAVYLELAGRSAQRRVRARAT
jgi:glycosyltransferase involved in cell wall biosynthesis